MEAIEYVTPADLRAWNWVTENSRIPRNPLPKAKDNPKPPRKRPKLEPVELNEPIEPKATKKRVEAVVQYQRTVEVCRAVVKALDVVTVRLGYNLTDTSNTEAKKHRRAGWHTFCALIQLMVPGYTVRSVDNALSVPNKPCREVLSNMFEVCRKECGYSDAELRRWIDK